jgi:DNA-binding SARP family transcriptional activator
LLGPVEAWADGRVLDLGPPKRRLVLASLLLELGRVLPLERIVDVLWPASPPPGARRVIFAHVSRLRRVLADAGAARHGVELARSGSGYVLHADPPAVDAHQFRLLCHQARAVAADRARVALLSQALNLWRGPALSGVAPGDVALQLCQGLNEARAVAYEDLFDARLRLGEHAHLTDELADVVQLYPLRERPVEQLMLALHSSGRTAGALLAYGALQQRLADELGVDPGPRLRGLHLAILREDPALRLPPAVVDADGPVGPDSPPPTVPT